MSTTTISGGSSPLARGLQGPHRAVQERRGIIPARAGFTGRCRSRARGRRDHPRSRGVYGSWGTEGRMHQGSSPLARGLPDVWTEDGMVGGIIPARAGFTPASRRRWRCARDHPRSRGVYQWRPSAMAVWRGSSPLARGLPAAMRAIGNSVGIIPARAGFTGLGGIPGGESRDHPRSRGVYRGSTNSTEAAFGSSPLARGLLDGLRADLATVRIIPARAGFTP